MTKLCVTKSGTFWSLSVCVCVCVCVCADVKAVVSLDGVNAVKP